MKLILYNNIKKERPNAAGFGAFNLAISQGKSVSEAAKLASEAAKSLEVGAKGALEVYQSTLFESINNELRFDKPDKHKQIIGKIDSSMTEIIDENLYRGLDADFTKIIYDKYKIKPTDSISDINRKLVGKIIKDKGYSSTTRSVKVAGEFASDKGKGRTTVMQIEGKKKGVSIDKYVNNYRSRKEREVLLKRNSKFLIKRVSFSRTGKLIIYTEYLG